jgi:hypothetical protein
MGKDFVQNWTVDFVHSFISAVGIAVFLLFTLFVARIYYENRTRTEDPSARYILF